MTGSGADQDRAARELLEQESGIGTWEMEVGSGRIIWSATTHRLHGTDPGAGQWSVEMSLARYPAASRAILGPAFERLVATGAPYDLELAFLAPDGSERTVRTLGRAIQGDGAVVRVLGTIEDITDRRERERAHAELERTRALLEESQGLARIGHWHADVATELLTWSPVVFEIFGLDPQTYVPHRTTIRQFLHPDDVAVVDAIEATTLRTGTHEVDYRLVRPDGQVLALHQLGRLERDPDTGATRVLGTLQDVTELRRTERALRDSEEVLQRVLTAARDGWWDIDLVMGEAFYSDRWWELHSYRQGELPSDPDAWRRLTHPDVVVRVEAELDAVLVSRQRRFVLSSEGLHRDGRRVPMILRGLVDYDPRGRPTRMSGSTSDVTEARQAELAKEEFVSTVSHELRTPLTSIGGALDLLEAGAGGQLAPAAAQLVEIGQRNTARLRGLIDDLLDLERLSRDDQGFRHATEQLAELVQVTIADHQPLERLHGVRFRLASPGDGDLVHIDRARIQQVLANYLSNAARFAPKGSTIEVYLAAARDNPARVRVEVVDDGPGVPPQLGERVFERFVQADPTDPRSRGGTGLGLAISREIVERHGGAVGMASLPGRTCFWFDLPRAEHTTP